MTNLANMAAYNHGIMLGRYGVDPILNGQVRPATEEDGRYWYGARPQQLHWFEMGLRLGRTRQLPPAIGRDAVEVLLRKENEDAAYNARLVSRLKIRMPLKD